mgnify:FL=1
MQRCDGLVKVQPWPFKNEQFTVNIEACKLSQVKFNHSQELSQAICQAPINVLHKCSGMDFCQELVPAFYLC